MDVNDAIPLSNFYGADNYASISILSLIGEGADTTSMMDTNALGMHTIVEYTMPLPDERTTTVRYFSQSASGSAQSQAALVRGDIGNYIRDISRLPELGRIRQSLGENAQSKREIFYREIRKVIGNQSPADLISGIKVINQNVINGDQRIDGKILYYRCNNDRPRLVNGTTVPCMIILDDNEIGGNDTLEINGNEINGNLTIVAIGADIYIDSNIDGTGATGRLAIIALEDLNRSEPRKGGNGYLCASVTDVELNAVFDNTLFSYGASETNCGENTVSDSDIINGKNALVGRDNGIPIVRGSITETFKRQLAWTGTLVSNNTYGGATAVPPVMGDGTRAETPEERTNARWYDVNFLRWAHVVDGDTPGAQCWASDVELSLTIGTSCASNGPATYGIVNFFYSPAPKEQAIFNVEM